MKNPEVLKARWEAFGFKDAKEVELLNGDVKFTSINPDGVLYTVIWKEIEITVNRKNSIKGIEYI